MIKTTLKPRKQKISTKFLLLLFKKSSLWNKSTSLLILWQSRLVSCKTEYALFGCFVGKNFKILWLYLESAPLIFSKLKYLRKIKNSL